MVPPTVHVSAAHTSCCLSLTVAASADGPPACRLPLWGGRPKEGHSGRQCDGTALTAQQGAEGERVTRFVEGCVRCACCPARGAPRNRRAGRRAGVAPVSDTQRRAVAAGCGSRTGLLGRLGVE
jgi:hypothetical protein